MKRRHAFARRNTDEARPLPVAAAYAALAGAAAAVGFGVGLPWRLSLAATAACLLVGVVRATRAALALARRRRPSFTPVPLNRRAVRPHLPLVRSLAARISDVDHAVAPRGMVLVEELITDGFESPLYVGGRVEDVSKSIERSLAALDGDGVAARSSEREVVEFTSRPGRRARVHTGGGLR